jgi:hypothetical protein
MDGERLRPEEHSSISPPEHIGDGDKKSGRASRHFRTLAQAAFVVASLIFAHGKAGIGESVTHNALAMVVASKKNSAIIVASLTFVTHKTEQEEDESDIG